MGGTFDDVDYSASVWIKYATFGWLERFERLCCGFFECILLGPGDPDHLVAVWRVWCAWFLQPWCLERVV